MDHLNLLVHVGWGGYHPPLLKGASLPFKANADRRHHIPKQRYRAMNSAACNAALRQRGSLTVWFTEEAIVAWKAEPRPTPGGQPRYSGLAMATALTLRAVFRLALPWTEGLIGSIVALLGLEPPVPDHTTLRRRAKTLEVPPLWPHPSRRSTPPRWTGRSPTWASGGRTCRWSSLPTSGPTGASATALPPRYPPHPMRDLHRSGR
jgi:hypothetical protein